MPYIMAVDLGGTNCRFAGFTLDKGILSLHRMGKRKTEELPDTGALISACGTALDRHPRTADALGSETGTLRWYARFYARACRNWALSTLCTGGLFITGGIALRNPLVTECATFREAFYEGSHRGLLERIPVRRFTDMNSGLWGSAWFGMRMTA